MKRYVHMKMDYPFGNDAKIDAYIQIDGNENALKRLNEIMGDHVIFDYIYSEQEVDGFMAFHDQYSYYTGSYDNMEFVKLSGQLDVPDFNYNNYYNDRDSLEIWWENIVGYPKYPDFTKLAENVQLLPEKSDREIYEFET